MPDGMPPTKPRRFTLKRSALAVAALVVAVFAFLTLQNHGNVTPTPTPVNTPVLVTFVDRNLDPDVKAEFELKIQTLEAAMNSDSQAAADVGQMLQLANLKYAYGDLAGSKEWYEKILALHPEDDAANENLGQTLLEMGDYAGAESHWREALKTNQSETTYIRIADLIAEHFPDRQAEIQPFLEDAIATIGQTPGLLVRLGQWYEANGQYDEALSHYHVAKQLSPDDSSIDQLISEAQAAQAKAAKTNGK